MRFFLLFINEISIDNPVFKMNEILVEIINILLSDIISEEMLVILDNNVASFLKICSEFDDHFNITVKFHHLIHYSECIRKFGPPKFFRTINFESIHSKLKKLIQNSKNWKAVEYTIATKYSRTDIFTEDLCLKGTGISEFNFELPLCMNFLYDSKIYNLKKLYINNEIYSVDNSAIIFEKSDEALKILRTKNIFKIDQNFFYMEMFILHTRTIIIVLFWMI